MSYSLGKISDGLIDQIHKAKGTFFKELLEDNPVRCREGVSECLQACINNGVKVGLITTTTPENIELLGESLRQQIDFNSFDLITTKADVDREKPDPEVYNFAIRKFACPLEDFVAVEDTEVNQEAALQTGLFCYLFAGEYATTSYNINSVRSLRPLADNI